MGSAGPRSTLSGPNQGEVLQARAPRAVGRTPQPGQLRGARYPLPHDESLDEVARRLRKVWDGPVRTRTGTDWKSNMESAVRKSDKYYRSTLCTKSRLRRLMRQASDPLGTRRSLALIWQEVNR